MATLNQEAPLLRAPRRNSAGLPVCHGLHIGLFGCVQVSFDTKRSLLTCWRLTIGNVWVAALIQESNGSWRSNGAGLGVSHSLHVEESRDTSQ